MAWQVPRQRLGGEVEARLEHRLAAAPIEQIEVWMDRVLSAATLAEVLAQGRAPERRSLGVQARSPGLG